jgi:hypothetical protein
MGHFDLEFALQRQSIKELASFWEFSCTGQDIDLHKGNSLGFGRRFIMPFMTRAQIRQALPHSSVEPQFKSEILTISVSIRI